MPAVKGKSGLSKQELKELAQRLLAQKKELESALSRNEVTNCDQRNDIGDRGNSEQQVVLTVGEQSRKRKDLAKVMGALERIEKGTIGKCQGDECEGNGFISFVRLKEMPNAMLCWECETADEERRRKK